METKEGKTGNWQNVWSCWICPLTRMLTDRQMRWSSCCRAPPYDSVWYKRLSPETGICPAAVHFLICPPTCHQRAELSSDWLGLLPVFEVRWVLTPFGGDVPMVASDRATGRGSRRSSSMPPPLLALAFLGCCPWCGSLDEPPAPLQDKKILTVC